MRRLPGDPDKNSIIERMIRVNHAGEYGAKQIYSGQISVLKDPKDQKLLNHMLNQELEHLDYFSKQLTARKIRPSIFMPVWHGLGYLIGAVTAYIGKDAAMVCTDAVEEVIDKHYQQQLKELEADTEQDLCSNISKFREEEIEHQKIAQDNLQRDSIANKLLYHFIKLGCKVSIKLAKF